MNALPSKYEIRKLFPGYRVSIEEKQMNVAVGTLQLQSVPALIVTCIASKTERYGGTYSNRYRNHPVEMDALGEGLRVVKEAGYNAFCSNFGLTIIPSDIIRGKF